MALWVFGYGSLMWDAGFEPAARQRAVLRDYHRSFCMLSIHHRGTETDPGLVLALDAAPGRQCTGVALLVAPAEEAAVLAMLRERELISSAYLETTVTLELDDGAPVEALAYVIDRDHVQYCQFEPEKQANMIAFATGGRGPNRDYLFNTTEHLSDMAIRDSEMEWLSARVRQLTRAD
jgi:cation transport protein ChaC